MNDLCPVTSGAATRMTRESFARTCAGKRRERQGCDWVFTRCETCKGRPENWPPELEIIEMEATMTAKKPTRSKETELLAKLQLEVAEKEKRIEILEKEAEGRIAALEGEAEKLERRCDELRGVFKQACEMLDIETYANADDMLPAIAALQTEVTALQKGMAERDRQLDTLIADADRWQKQAKELEDEWSDAKARIAQLEDEATEAWTILDGAGAGTLIEVAEKRWKEIETLRGQLELARNTIKDREQVIEELEEAADPAIASPIQDDGEAAGILRDLMRKLVDGRISLIHNHA